MKGVSPGPFTEEFLTVQQRRLRILGGLSMAGEYSQLNHRSIHIIPEPVAMQRLTLAGMSMRRLLLRTCHVCYLQA